ncbi:MAG TPA: indole-3-glycerol phosphate synthase TrpC [Methanomicrobiales archaeon]|nr:indole-3-glycerol phosphate synthase TrpC [Methanomicrobiales archaeon]
MILDEILESTRGRVRVLEGRRFPLPAYRPRSLAGAIRGFQAGNAIIAEVKFSSPSRGTIRPPAPPETLARELVAGGARALSVLTEPRFFGGSPEFLGRVRRAVGVPVLRKDFIIDPLQLEETRSLGADAVLLIAGLLGGRLGEFVKRAQALELEPLVEVRTEREARAALETGAELIGVNNRDLRTMEIDLSTTLALGPLIQGAGRLVVSESGICAPGDIRTLRQACDAFLIGTSVMTSRDPGKMIEEFLCA